MNYITLYTSDGSLNMKKELKPKFRKWAYEELKLAFPEFTIEISLESNNDAFEMFSEENKYKYNNMAVFVDEMYDRWDVIIGKKEGRKFEFLPLLKSMV